MSEWRTIGASLELKYQSYIAGMERSGAATRKFATELATAATGTKDFEAASRKLDQVGSKLTRNVTLPVGLAGVAAVKLASDFDTTFTKMASLAGVPADKLDGLKQKVLALSHDTAQSPQALAEALYQIESSGVGGAQAMDVLSVSAKAAAIGMGDSANVADALTSAMNTYGADTLSAAQAGDTLAAAVKVGKGEAAEFAPQLGRLLPLANNLGVSFGQVSGALAFLTRTSGDTSQSSTQLLGALSKLLKPSIQGQQVLAQYGKSADWLRQTVADKGLLPALDTLSSLFDGNRKAMGQFFDDVEGLQGFLALTRDSQAAASAIDEVSNSAGGLDTAFRGLSKTDAFKLKQDLADLQRVGVKLGEDLIPIVSKIAGGISGLANVFGDLPGPVQAGILGFVGFAAVLGPVLKMAGNLGLVAGGIKGFSQGLRGIATEGGGAANSFGKFLSSSGALTFAAGAAIPALGAAAAGLAIFEINAEQSRQRAAELAATLSQVKSEMDATGKSAAQAFHDTTLVDFATKNKKALETAGVSVQQLAKAVTGSHADWAAFLRDVGHGPNQSAGTHRLIADLTTLRLGFTNARSETNTNQEVLEGLGVQTDKTAAATDGLTGALDGAAGASGGASAAFDDQTQALHDQWDAMQSAASAHKSYTDALAELAEKQQAARSDSTEMRRARQSEVDAEKALATAQRDSRTAQLGLNTARADAARQLRDLALAAKGAALGEEGAEISLERARENLAKLNGQGTQNEWDAAQQGAQAPPSDLDRREAELAVKQAELALQQAHNSNTDTAQQLAQSQAKGVEGSDQVVAAKQRIVDAADSEQQAERRVGEAAEAIRDLRVKAAKDVRDAIDRVHDSQLADIEAQRNLTLLTDGAKTASDNYIVSLLQFAALLDPNSPLRKNLTTYIADLAALNAPATVDPTSAIPPTRDPDAGPRKPTRSLGASKMPNAKAPRAPLVSHDGAGQSTTPTGPRNLVGAGSTYNIFTADTKRTADHMMGWD